MTGGLRVAGDCSWCMGKAVREIELESTCGNLFRTDGKRKMTSAHDDQHSDERRQKVALFGDRADSLTPLLRGYAMLQLEESHPDVVVCFGGDGTLLAAELRWPGIPKAPILNSRRGHRCIPRPPQEVLKALAAGTLVRNTYTKLECAVFPARETTEPDFVLTCLNEVNAHMGRINSAVRFRLWIDEEPFDSGVEIVSDGFIACTAFGSTAYFKAMTKGIFTRGIGIALKATTYPINHMILPEDVVARFEITRGPVTLAFDNSPEYVDLKKGDTLLVRKHAQSAIILTCAPVVRLDEPF